MLRGTSISKLGHGQDMIMLAGIRHCGDCGWRALVGLCEERRATECACVRMHESGPFQRSISHRGGFTSASFWQTRNCGSCWQLASEGEDVGVAGTWGSCCTPRLPAAWPLNMTGARHAICSCSDSCVGGCYARNAHERCVRYRSGPHCGAIVQCLLYLVVHAEFFISALDIGTVT